LEQAGYTISAIAGTSMGAMVGSFYAAGYSPDEIEEIFSNVDQSKLYELGLLAQPGLLGLGRVSHFLDEMLGEKTFADTRIPAAFVAADLGCNCEAVLSTGLLKDAVLASIAVPGVFPPRNLDGRHLVDGGVLNPVPVSVARKLASKLPVVAVALSPPFMPENAKLPTQITSVIPEVFIKRITRLNVSQAMSVFLQSVDISNQAITELRLEKEPPDILIRPKVEGIGLLDNVVVADVAKLGEEATEAILPELERVVRRSRGIINILFGGK
jgi:NTE family protein